MYQTRYLFLALLFSFVVAACRMVTTRPTGVALGEVFTLKGGQQVFIEGEDLRLKLDAVLEDSRCPTQVNCFWTGQARIAVIVQQADGEVATLEFNTNPALDQNRQTVTYRSYIIQLQSLDPYPEHPDRPIPFEDYVATLVVM